MKPCRFAPGCACGAPTVHKRDLEGREDRGEQSAKIATRSREHEAAEARVDDPSRRGRLLPSILAVILVAVLLESVSQLWSASRVAPHGLFQHVLVHRRRAHSAVGCSTGPDPQAFISPVRLRLVSPRTLRAATGCRQLAVNFLRVLPRLLLIVRRLHSAPSLINGRGFPQVGDLSVGVLLYRVGGGATLCLDRARRPRRRGRAILRMARPNFGIGPRVSTTAWFPCPSLGLSELCE